MSDDAAPTVQEIASTASATNSSALDALFGPAQGAAGASAPAPAQEAAAETQAPAPAATPPAGPSLAELIRQQRADRAARAAREEESNGLRAELEQAKAALSKFSKSDLLGDPIGFAEAHGLSEQEMALVGQAYLYHLAPDKAPESLRYRLMEAKRAREDRTKEQATKAQAEEQAQRAVAERIQQYAGAVNAQVQSWESSGAEHPFPASQAWFGGNHAEYTESLIYTANNIAEAARARGEVADLSPQAVAKALEADVSARMARFRGSKPSESSARPAEPAAGKQPAVLSTRGQGASPTPPATSDEERMRRAMEVVFAPR